MAKLFTVMRSFIATYGDMSGIFFCSWLSHTSSTCNSCVFKRVEEEDLNLTSGSSSSTIALERSNSFCRADFFMPA